MPPSSRYTSFVILNRGKGCKKNNLNRRDVGITQAEEEIPLANNTIIKGNHLLFSNLPLPILPRSTFTPIRFADRVIIKRVEGKNLGLR
jgi:hypothetical protein